MRKEPSLLISWALCLVFGLLDRSCTEPVLLLPFDLILSFPSAGAKTKNRV